MMTYGTFSLRDRWLISRDCLLALVFEARKCPADSDLRAWLWKGIREARKEYRACLRAHMAWRGSTGARGGLWGRK